MPTHYKAVLTMVLGFMLTLTGISIVFRTQIEKFFDRFRNREQVNMESEQHALQHKRFISLLWGLYWACLLHYRQ